MSSLPFIIIGEFQPFNKRISLFLNWQTDKRSPVSQCCHKPMDEVIFTDDASNHCDDCSALSDVAEVLFPVSKVN